MTNDKTGNIQKSVEEVVQNYGPIDKFRILVFYNASHEIISMEELQDSLDELAKTQKIFATYEGKEAIYERS